jgi:reticulon-3
MVMHYFFFSSLFFCRPLPPLPNLEVSDAVVEKAADHAIVWINRMLAVGRDIAIKRDRQVFIQAPSLSLEILARVCLYCT